MMLSKFVDTLIRSEGNKVAVEAARDIQTIRNLMIYGDVGMGKTQLLNAIYRDIQNELPKANVKLISSDEFSRGLIKALKSQSYLEFMECFYSLDGLFIDDIEGFDGKPRTQKELCGLVKHFKETGKFLVITIGRDISGLDNLEVKCQALMSGMKCVGLGGIDATLLENFAQRLVGERGADCEATIKMVLQESNVQSFYDLIAVYHRVQSRT